MPAVATMAQASPGEEFMSQTDQPESAIPSDRTVIIQARPGKPSKLDRDFAPVQQYSKDDYLEAIQSASNAYRNPLLRAASHVLLAYSRIRATPHHDDPEGLRDALAQAIRNFETKAQALEVPRIDIERARYLLCTILDEAASNTPWGGRGVWAGQSLLGLFHKDAKGGENCFVLLRELLRDLRVNHNMLELFHVCLGLGFVGRYRVVEGGESQLASIRERLWTELRRQGSSPERELSTSWKSDVVAKEKRAVLPVWLMSAIAFVALLCLYGVLKFILGISSNSVVATINAMTIEPPQFRPTAPASQQPPRRLVNLLEPEIRAEKVKVVDRSDHSLVTIASDGLFAPGSADIESSAKPTLARVANELAKLPGRIDVIGYTDDRAIRGSMRYQTNEQLAKARADAVIALLAAGNVVELSRMRAVGRASDNPIAPNSTAEGRAKNRRVEIILFVAGGDNLGDRQ